METRGRGEQVLVLLACAVLIACVRFDLVPLLRGPAPYPPEWEWMYRPRSPLRVWMAMAAAGGLIALIAWSGRAVAVRRPRRASALLIAGACVLGLAFPLLLLEAEEGGPVGHLMRRTSSATYLSYHTVAASPAARDAGRFLRDYPRWLPELPMHAATHPPGPVLYFRALIEVFERSPGLAAVVNVPIRRACGEDGGGCGANVAMASPAARAAALVGAVGWQALAAATLFPIAWLAFGLTRDLLSAARVAALWPLLPGAALFVPALDPALAFPVTAAAAALREALVADTSGRRWTCVAGAGAMAGAAIFFSYGAPVFVGLAAVVAVASLPAPLLAARRRVLVRSLVAAGLVAVVVAALPMCAGYDPTASARSALSTHREEYTAKRSYALWLLFGPLDLAVFTGAPLVVGLIGAWLRAMVGRSGQPLPPPERLACALAGGTFALFLSGVVRGEVGRLLVPLMPMVLLAAATRLDTRPGPDARLAAIIAAGLTALAVALRTSWRI